MFNYFCHLLLQVPGIRLDLCPAAQQQYHHIFTINTAICLNLWVTFVSTLAIWNPARVTAPAELSKVLMNSQVLEEGSFILESQGRLNKLIKKYVWEHAVFKGNGFELNERLHIRKHSLGHKHTEALWQSWCDCCITFAIQAHVCSCVWTKGRESVSIRPVVQPSKVAVDGWLL